MGERPGQASVQYDDVRGEVAGDISDQLGDLQAAARKLGFKGRGHVVGISIYGGDEGHEILKGRRNGRVIVTFQVAEAGSADQIEKDLEKTNGVLLVKEYMKSDVPVADFLGCFKRLDVCVFERRIKEREISVEVTETNHLDDE